MATNIYESMDQFCGSEFWNASFSWNTNNPDVTICFQNTVLIWFPCAFLWTFAIVDVMYMKSSINKNVPWSFLNVTKLSITIILTILSVVDLVCATNGSDAADIYPVNYSTPIIKAVTFILSAILLYFNKRCGLRTSGVQFIFWVLLGLCSIPKYRLYSMRLYEISNADHDLISFLIFYGFVWIMLLLNCFADKEQMEFKYPRTPNPSPERGASFLSKIFYTWYDGMVWKGFRKPLEYSDLWDLNPQNMTKEVRPVFEKHWLRAVGKNEQISESVNPKATHENGKTSIKMQALGKRPAPKQVSILPVLFKSFGGTLIFGLLKLAQDLLLFVPPLILREIIIYVDQSSNSSDQQPPPLWKGIFFAVTLFIVASLQTIIMGQYFYRMFEIGLRIRTALINAIYRKALALSSMARKSTTVGEIVNLMAVDVQRFVEIMPEINYVWSAPLQIVLSIFFLWQTLGPSVLAGLAVMIILIPVNAYFINKFKVLQIRQMKFKDERVKLMNEILSGIKVLKLYAWEPSFEKQVLNVRDKEIQILRENAYIGAGTSFVWSCAPFLVSLVTFACFVLVDENNVLDAETAFVSLSLFNVLRFPFSMLPMLISSMVQTGVSIKRINKFMNGEELNPDNVQHDQSEKCPLLIENGQFSWNEDEIVLKNINMTVGRAKLAAVVGTVGSGKSSLISAYLGEMDKLSGRVNTVGSIAYVSQQAWIQNCTLRDNILFGKKWDAKLYKKVIAACALKPDIEMLQGGDQTEIGEKGINLSGGQKQRISLARAVYNEADIYFLDDPLSAVDSHVGKHIFEQVIGPNGLLAGKTRILVTHGISFLPQVDDIFVIRKGEISESGNYETLMNRKGAFAEFLIQHLQEVNETDGVEDLDELKQQLESKASIVDKELIGKLERAISRRSERAASEQPSAVDQFSRTISDGGDASTPLLTSSSSVTSINGSFGSKEDPSLSQVTAGDNKLIEQERAQIGNVKWAVYKHYFKSIGIPLVIATILSNTAYQAFTIGSSLWLSKWSSDKTIGNDTNTRDIYLGVYGGLGFGQVVVSTASSLSLRIGCLYASVYTHKVLLAGIIRAPLTFFDTTPIGRILARFSNDIETIDSALLRTLYELTWCLFQVIGTIVVISISTYSFLAVIIPIGILYYFVQRFYIATSRQLKRLESISRSPIYSHFGETIQGSQTIRAYQLHDRFIQSSDDRVDFNQTCYCLSIMANRWLEIRLQIVANLIILFSALFAVLSRDTISAGIAGVSISYAMQITQIMNWLVRMTADLETNIVAVERAKEYGETTPEAPWEIAETRPDKHWPNSGRVEFRNFQIRYREGLELVLKGISFTVNGGEKIGIVGRTGAGKSSLTLALFRIIESAGGSIIIDGKDISKLGLHDLRSRLTIIPQDPVLFAGSLRMNLDPFEKSTDTQLWTALSHAHLRNFVSDLPAGLNYEISEGGENLSVGQRQLVCLARALLRKTKILILDEATAAVDLETDDLIQNTIRREFKDCTVLTIAHRLNTIMDSDRVIVLDGGHLAEYASPIKLLQNRNSIFYGMAHDAGMI